MKKVFVIQDFSKPAISDLQGALTIAYKRGEKLYLANLDFPADRVAISHDRIKQTVMIEIRLFENEYLAMGDKPGTADKREILSLGALA